MKLLSLTCNHCGAPLEVREKTRFVTCGFCHAKLAIHSEGNAVYTELLEEIHSRTGRIENRLANIERQNEIAQLDREWEAERDRLLVQGKHGRRHVPSRGGTLFGSAIMAAFGLFWTVGAFAAGAPIAIFGFIFIAASIGMGIYGLQKAEQYEVGRRRFEARRASLLGDDSAQTFWDAPTSDS